MPAFTLCRSDFVYVNSSKTQYHEQLYKKIVRAIYQFPGTKYASAIIFIINFEDSEYTKNIFKW